MTKTYQRTYVIISVLICAAAMSLVDGIVQPPYAVKSLIKVVLFLLIPMGYFLVFPRERGQMRTLFAPKKKDLLIALGFGAAVYWLILGGYWVLTRFFDISDVVLQATSAGGVTPDNFLFVSLYISFVNSLLEEFLFRGFAFITLKNITGRGFAYVFSALIFALYHLGMIASGMHLVVCIVAIAGLFIAGCVLDFLNEKSGNIYVSWLVHMFANFGINTIGFYIFGLI